MSRRPKQPHVVDIDFQGPVIPPQVAETEVGSATGAPKGDHYLLSLEATDEVQVAELNTNDLLGYDIDDVQYVDFWVTLSGNLAANDQLTIGLGSARNNDARSIAERIVFTVDGGSTVLKVNTDDGTDDKSVTSSVNLTHSVVTHFRLNLKEGIDRQADVSSKAGKASVQFYADNVNGQLRRIETPGKHMSMNNYSGGLQPIVQLRKASGTSAVTLKVHRIRVQMLKEG